MQTPHNETQVDEHPLKKDLVDDVEHMKGDASICLVQSNDSTAIPSRAGS